MARPEKKKKSQVVKPAVRLPSGAYAWRGRAVPFSRLPKAERERFRSSWARKGARLTRKRKKTAAKYGVSGEFLALVKDRETAAVHKHRDIERSFTIKVGKKSVLACVKAAKVRARIAIPPADRGVWSMTLAWPDDPRSSPGRAVRTFAGFEPMELGKMITEKDRDFARYVENIRETNGAALERGNRISSGAAGKVEVVSISLLVWESN